VRLDLLAEQAVIVAGPAHQPGVSPRRQPTTVSGAPAELTRAISNLLDNAVKWSSPDDPIDVTAAAGVCAFAIYGVGIAAETCRTSFDRFYLSPRTPERSPARAWALRSCARSPRRTNGRATAEAAPGGGTIISIRLPAGPLAPGAT